jgi:hypothetical protein
VRRIFFGIMALALSSALPAGAQQPPEPPPFHMVMGTGEARVPSDRARLDFMVETQARTAAAASTQNAERMQQVVAALRSAGGQTVTIETGGYELQPVYRQVPRDESGIPVIASGRARTGSPVCRSRPRIRSRRAPRRCARRWRRPGAKPRPWPPPWASPWADPWR